MFECLVTLSHLLWQIAGLLKDNEKIQSNPTITPSEDDSEIKKIKKVSFFLPCKSFQEAHQRYRDMRSSSSFTFSPQLTIFQRCNHISHCYMIDMVTQLKDWFKHVWLKNIWLKCMDVSKHQITARCSVNYLDTSFMCIHMLRPPTKSQIYHMAWSLIWPSSLELPTGSVLVLNGRGHSYYIFIEQQLHTISIKICFY